MRHAHTADMFCLPLDNVCQMDKFQHEVIAEAAETAFANRHTFSLGTFNGRRFVYTLFDGKPVIVIIEENKSFEYNATYSDILGD